MTIWAITPFTVVMPGGPACDSDTLSSCHRFVRSRFSINVPDVSRREGAWDKAARDPNDEMVSAGLTPDNIRKWEYLKSIQGQNETVKNKFHVVVYGFVFELTF